MSVAIPSTPTQMNINHHYDALSDVAASATKATAPSAAVVPSSSSSSSSRRHRPFVDSTIDDSASLRPPVPGAPPLHVKRYRRGRHLGKGGFAQVYAFTSVDSGREYAMKIIPKETIVKESSRKKLLNEIAIHRVIKHEHVVRFERFFEDKKNIYIALELCPHHTMMELVKARGRLTETEAQFFLYQIVITLEHLHGERVIHRDMKLGNLFLSDGLQIKVGDFGLATRLEVGDEKRRTICGTPNYISPEILDGSQGHGFEVDVWACGVILYTLLFGLPPFETSNVKSTYKKIRENAYEFPAYGTPLYAPVSHAAKDLIRGMLKHDPADRLSLHAIRTHPFFTQSPFPFTRLPNEDVLRAPLQWNHSCLREIAQQAQVDRVNAEQALLKQAATASAGLSSSSQVLKDSTQQNVATPAVVPAKDTVTDPQSSASSNARAVLAIKEKAATKERETEAKPTTRLVAPAPVDSPAPSPLSSVVSHSRAAQHSETAVVSSSSSPSTATTARPLVRAREKEREKAHLATSPSSTQIPSTSSRSKSEREEATTTKLSPQLLRRQAKTGNAHSPLKLVAAIPSVSPSAAIPVIASTSSPVLSASSTAPSSAITPSVPFATLQASPIVATGRTACVSMAIKKDSILRERAEVITRINQRAMQSAPRVLVLDNVPSTTAGSSVTASSSASPATISSPSPSSIPVSSSPKIIRVAMPIQAPLQQSSSIVSSSASSSNSASSSAQSPTLSSASIRSLASSRSNPMQSSPAVSSSSVSSSASPSPSISYPSPSIATSSLVASLPASAFPYASSPAIVRSRSVLGSPSPSHFLVAPLSSRNAASTSSPSSSHSSSSSSSSSPSSSSTAIAALPSPHHQLCWNDAPSQCVSIASDDSISPTAAAALSLKPAPSAAPRSISQPESTMSSTSTSSTSSSSSSIASAASDFAVSLLSPTSAAVSTRLSLVSSLPLMEAQIRIEQERIRREKECITEKQMRITRAMSSTHSRHASAGALSALSSSSASTSTSASSSAASSTASVVTPSTLPASSMPASQALPMLANPSLVVFSSTSKAPVAMAQNENTPQPRNVLQSTSSSVSPTITSSVSAAVVPSSASTSSPLPRVPEEDENDKQKIRSSRKVGESRIVRGIPIAFEDTSSSSSAPYSPPLALPSVLVLAWLDCSSHSRGVGFLYNTGHISANFHDEHETRIVCENDDLHCVVYAKDAAWNGQRFVLPASSTSAASSSSSVLPACVPEKEHHALHELFASTRRHIRLLREHAQQFCIEIDERYRSSSASSSAAASASMNSAQMPMVRAGHLIPSSRYLSLPSTHMHVTSSSRDALGNCYGFCFVDATSQWVFRDGTELVIEKKQKNQQQKQRCSARRADEEEAQHQDELGEEHLLHYLDKRRQRLTLKISDSLLLPELFKRYSFVRKELAQWQENQSKRLLTLKKREQDREQADQGQDDAEEKREKSKRTQRPQSENVKQAQQQADESAPSSRRTRSITRAALVSVA